MWAIDPGSQVQLLRSGDGDGKQQAVDELGRLAKNDGIRRSIVEAGGIEQLVIPGALSRHRRRHVHRAGMGLPVFEMTASLRGGHFEYRHARLSPTRSF